MWPFVRLKEPEPGSKVGALFVGGVLDGEIRDPGEGARSVGRVDVGGVSRYRLKRLWRLEGISVYEARVWCEETMFEAAENDMVGLQRLADKVTPRVPEEHWVCLEGCP
jgi:hypothetical protein